MWGQALSYCRRMPFWLFSLFCFIELMQLLNVDFHIECLIALKQFIMNYAFPVPSYTQHGLWGCFACRVTCFWELSHFSTASYWCEGTIFHCIVCGKENTACDHVLSDVKQGKKQWFWSADIFCFHSKCMALKCWVSEPFPLSEGGSPQFLITINLLCQFSGHLTWIFVKKLIHSFFIKFNWLTSLWSILNVKIPIFEVRKPTVDSTLRHYSFSIHSTNLTSSFGILNTSVKCKRQMVSKMLSFVHLTFHLMIWKYIKINKIKKSITLSYRPKTSLSNSIKN